MNKIELVVFDIAGTTVRDNGQVADSFKTAFREAGIEVPEEEVNKVMGWRKIDAVRRLLDKYAAERHTDQLAASIHDRFIEHMVEFYKNDEDLEPLPYAETLFARLHDQGIKVALNTGFTRVITDAILHRLQWDNGVAWIDKVICSDEVAEGRPYPYMIDSLIKDLGISSPGNILKVGDTEVDIEEGRNARCGTVVSVTTGAYTRTQLEQYKPDYIIDSLEELIPIIEHA